MKRNLVLLFTLYSVFAQAQEEIYFGEKKEIIKVQTLKGLEMRVSLFPTGDNPKRLTPPDSFDASLYLGYYIENPSASNWTFIKTIGIHNIAYSRPEWKLQMINDTTKHYYSTHLSTAYALELEAGIEPRWYCWVQKKSNPHNSGLFVTFPILIEFVILHSPEPIFNLGLLPKSLTVNFSISPTVGYRYSISKKMFFEGSVGMPLITYSIPHLVYRSRAYPQFKLKTAYTF